MNFERYRLRARIFSRTFDEDYRYSFKKHAIVYPMTIDFDRLFLNSVCLHSTNPSPIFLSSFSLVTMLNELMQNLHCTLVFVDENMMNITQLLIKHRLIITEINENYLNYMSKKLLAIDCLDSIKANLRSQSLGDRGYDTFVSNEQKVHMCKHLYSKSLMIISLSED